MAISEKLRSNGIADLKYSEVKILLDDFVQSHLKISNYICSDFGIKAMYYDGLIIEDCLRELMIKKGKKGIPILPIHDELLCPVESVDVVKEQMVLSYRKVLKNALVSSGKMAKDDPLPNDLCPIIKQG